jgi:hypothetical protein
MSIIVEDGTGEDLEANSYVTEAELTSYSSLRGITIPDEDREMYLTLAMDYFESLDFKGTKTSETQPLQFPRTDLFIDGVEVDDDVIHKLVKDSQLEAAIASFQGNSFTAVKERAVKRERINGAVEVEYMDNSASSDLVVAFNVKVKKLLKSSGNIFFRVSRI